MHINKCKINKWVEVFSKQISLEEKIDPGTGVNAEFSKRHTESLV